MMKLAMIILIKKEVYFLHFTFIIKTPLWPTRGFWHGQSKMFSIGVSNTEGVFFIAYFIIIYFSTQLFNKLEKIVKIRIYLVKFSFIKTDLSQALERVNLPIKSLKKDLVFF